MREVGVYNHDDEHRDDDVAAERGRKRAKKAAADEHKLKGNNAYKAKSFDEAVKHYEAAIEALTYAAASPRLASPPDLAKTAAPIWAAGDNSDFSMARTEVSATKPIEAAVAHDATKGGEDLGRIAATSEHLCIATHRVARHHIRWPSISTAGDVLPIVGLGFTELQQ